MIYHLNLIVRIHRTNPNRGTLTKQLACKILKCQRQRTRLNHSRLEELRDVSTVVGRLLRWPPTTPPPGVHSLVQSPLLECAWTWQLTSHEYNRAKVRECRFWVTKDHNLGYKRL